MRGGRAGTSAGHGGSTVCHAIQTRTVEGCAVLTSVPRRTRGIVHFIGGAFVGALPQAAYPLLIRRVADAGYTVVCTPYKVSFKHLDCASRVRTKFQSALAALEASDWSSVAPREAPVLGIGHSQGSLLHMLAGSLYGHSERRTANVVMSFNNKQVADAVPIPGFLDNIGPVATTLEGLGVRSPDLTQALRQLQGLSPTGPWAGLDPKILADLQPALDQIPDAVNEIRDGTRDFTPPPAESLRLISASYQVPRTLLVRFRDDPIDESRKLQRALIDGGRNPADCALVELAGSHVTPCAPDAGSGGAFAGGGRGSPSPLEVVSAGAALLLARETQLLADRVVAFLDSEALG